jgi:hypothetical protein
MNRAQKNEKGEFERRIKTRCLSTAPVFYVANQRLYEGKLLNFSEAGASISTVNILFSGDRVTVALPHEDRKRMGKVVWSKGHSIGIRF